MKSSPSEHNCIYSTLLCPSFIYSTLSSTDIMSQLHLQYGARLYITMMFQNVILYLITVLQINKQNRHCRDGHKMLTVSDNMVKSATAYCSLMGSFPKHQLKGNINSDMKESNYHRRVDWHYSLWSLRTSFLLHRTKYHGNKEPCSFSMPLWLGIYTKNRLFHALVLHGA